MIPSTCSKTCVGARATMPRCSAKYGGDERKALTAYNWGPGNLDKVNGDVTKAPPETQAYVRRVLGAVGQALLVARQARHRHPRLTRVWPSSGPHQAGQARRKQARG